MNHLLDLENGECDGETQKEIEKQCGDAAVGKQCGDAAVGKSMGGEKIEREGTRKESCESVA